MSSSSENGGGCGCLLPIIGLLAALVLTRPSETDHRKAIAERTPITHTIFAVQKWVSGDQLTYHDYYVCSVMTVKLSKTDPELPISFGLFGKVYYSNDK